MGLFSNLKAVLNAGSHKHLQNNLLIRESYKAVFSSLTAVRKKMHYDNRILGVSQYGEDRVIYCDCEFWLRLGLSG